MDRFEYSDARLARSEKYIIREKAIKLYDGDQKTNFENGELVLTNHRLLWGHPGDIPRGNTCLSLSLRYVVFAEEEVSSTFSFSQTKKIIIHLSEALPGKIPGPVSCSIYSHIKLGFKEGMQNDFLNVLNDNVQKKEWELQIESNSNQSSQTASIKLRTGIVGIERSIQEKHKATDESITVAFQDLSKLMIMAKDMVSLSKTISQKIREKQGYITDDETVTFKSYLLSLGIDDPVTRNDFRSDSQYYESLAKQVATMLEEPIKEVGGMMPLADAYCRVNRARGLELLSPEDLLRACQLLERLALPLRLRRFDSGALVLHLPQHSDAHVADATAHLLNEHGSLTAAQLAQNLGLSVLLAKERLLTTEKMGLACRDDSIEGLRFYPNRFLQDP